MTAPTAPAEPHQTSSGYDRVLRQAQYSLLSSIQRKLERRRKTPCFADEELGDMLVTRGAPFDIDQDDPIDLEPRFFLPGPVDKMEDGIRERSLDPNWPNDPTDHWRQMWEKHPPVECHRLRNLDPVQTFHKAYSTVQEAHMKSAFCTSAAEATGDWLEIMENKVKIPWERKVWTGPDGKPNALCYRTDDARFWPLEPNKYTENPGVPHCLGAVSDIARPSHGGLLHSELAVAVYLIKTQLRKRKPAYRDHHIFPALFLSFHNIFSARVVQAHVENGTLVVRPSRLLKLYSATVPADAKLAIRWLNPRPVGDTRLPRAAAGTSTKEGLDQGLEVPTAPPTLRKIELCH